MGENKKKYENMSLLLSMFFILLSDFMYSKV